MWPVGTRVSCSVSRRTPPPAAALTCQRPRATGSAVRYTPVGPHAAAVASNTMIASARGRRASGADMRSEELEDDVVGVEVVRRSGDGVGGQVLIAVGPGVAAVLDANQLG